MARNLEFSRVPGPRGFLIRDADELYCKTLSGQCNMYSLHRVPADSKKGGDWILVVTLSGKIFRFATDYFDQSADRRSSPIDYPTIICNEFDLRNEFPSHYVDLEVTSSCLHQFDDGGQIYLFVACVDNRSQLVDTGRTPSGSGSISTPGIIFIVRITPPWKPLVPLATVVRTLTTSYAPCLITIFPLRRSEGGADDQILFVSGTDRSMHGYRIEITHADGDSGGKSRSGQISTCECFLGETSTEFDMFGRRGTPLPGTILKLEVLYSQSVHCDRLTAFGFDTGFLTICHSDAIRNHLVMDPVDRHFDAPISALKFLPCRATDSVPAVAHLSPPIDIDTPISLLVCPAIGPARLYPNVDDPNWRGTTVVTFPRSDQFDCLLCAESIFVHSPQGGVCYILLGTFGGKVLIYLLDDGHTSASLKRTHTFLSPVMAMRQFGQNYIAVLLTYTILIFEL